MVVLHRDERRQLVIDRIVLHRMELVGVAAGHPDIPCVSSLNNVVQGLHCLGDGCVGVKAVTLKDINVVKLKTLEGVLDRLKYMLNLYGEHSTL
jgi:hypothetical protein